MACPCVLLSFCPFFLSFFLALLFLVVANNLVCWLAYVSPTSSLRLAYSHCTAKSPWCICNAYLCLVVCERRARLSINRRHTTAVSARVLVVLVVLVALVALHFFSFFFVIVPGMLAFHLFYLDELRLFGLLCFTAVCL